MRNTIIHSVEKRYVSVKDVSGRLISVERSSKQEAIRDSIIIAKELKNKIASESFYFANGDSVFMIDKEVV